MTPLHPLRPLCLTSLAPLVALATSIAACSAKTEAQSAPPASMVEAVATLDDASPNGCDGAAKAARDSLAQVVDEKADAIATYGASLPADAHFRRVALGPTYVREIDVPFVAASPPVHVATGSTWSTLASEYQAIATTPVDTHWIDLNASLRFRVSEDWWRIVDGDLAGRSVHPSEPADANFVQNDGVSFHDGAFHVRLDPGPFAGVEPLLGAYITSVWTNDTHALVVDWTSADSDDSAFRVLLDEGPGGRSYVSGKERAVHLYADVRAKSIAHEIGHVLGFADRYYAVWNEATCTYETTEDDGDLMSVIDTGVVTDAEWAVLDAKYR